MTHLQGTQDEMLMSTAQYVITNSDIFTDAIVRWSESFLNGGISDGTFEQLLGAQGIVPFTQGQTSVPVDEVTQNQAGSIDFGTAFPLQTQQLSQLGQSINELTGSLDEQILIREQQRAEDNMQFAEHQALVARQLEELGVSVSDAGGDSFNPFLAGLGTGSVVILGAIAFILFKSR